MIYYLHTQYCLRKLTLHTLKEHHTYDVVCIHCVYFWFMRDKMSFLTHPGLKYCPLLAKRSLSFYHFVTSNI